MSISSTDVLLFYIFIMLFTCKFSVWGMHTKYQDGILFSDVTDQEVPVAKTHTVTRSWDGNISTASQGLHITKSFTEAYRGVEVKLHYLCDLGSK
jgi:hypothetical protein